MNSRFGRIARRGFVYVAAIAIALYIVVPIYLVAVMAFSPREVIYDYPKPIIPKTLSFETMSFFLNAYGVLDSLKNSLVVAFIALGITLIVGAPAGYAVCCLCVWSFFSLLLTTPRTPKQHQSVAMIRESINPK